MFEALNSTALSCAKSQLENPIATRKENTNNKESKCHKVSNQFIYTTSNKVLRYFYISMQYSRTIRFILVT